jgi:hypothetical protein
MSNRLDALTVREVGDKSYWTKIGVAFQGRDGASYIVKLDAIPAPSEGQFVIHLREPRDNSGTGDRPRPTNQSGTGGGYSGRGTQGGGFADDDYVPGFDR